jgi:methylenetetrahydrofolate reductase (NADPH)
MTETNCVSPDLAAMLSRASVEVSSRGHQLAELRDHFSPGIVVTVTFLPGDDYRHNVETAAALRRLGFNPVLHIAAREMRSRDALDDLLARARGEAEVNRILVIAGDSLRTVGPFKSSADICASGAIEAHGIGAVSFAGHPEGHPHLDADKAMAALTAKRDWGRKVGVRVDSFPNSASRAPPFSRGSRNSRRTVSTFRFISVSPVQPHQQRSPSLLCAAASAPH